ncbi:MAG TPA: hypothetical protein PLN24_00015 [Victivallales bacterium]|nr:hypothetical protein [Victivallales bacterium]
MISTVTTVVVPVALISSSPSLPLGCTQYVETMTYPWPVAVNVPPVDVSEPSAGPLTIGPPLRIHPSDSIVTVILSPTLTTAGSIVTDGLAKIETTRQDNVAKTEKKYLSPHKTLHFLPISFYYNPNFSFSKC